MPSVRHESGLLFAVLNFEKNFFLQCSQKNELRSLSTLPSKNKNFKSNLLLDHRVATCHSHNNFLKRVKQYPQLFLFLSLVLLNFKYYIFIFTEFIILNSVLSLCSIVNNNYLNKWCCHTFISICVSRNSKGRTLSSLQNGS